MARTRTFNRDYSRPLPKLTAEERAEAVAAVIRGERRTQVRLHCPHKDLERCPMLDGAVCFDERCETDCQRPGGQPIPERCTTCNGDGTLEVPDPQRDDPHYARVVQCQDCHGNGWN